MHDIHTSGQTIAIGREFVPRFAQFLAGRLVVPEGETLELPPDATYDAIEVHGTLRVSRDYDTVLRFTHLFVMPMGRLDMGTADDPVLRKVEFIIRDKPLDAGHDPFQWGNSILNFGTWTSHGRAMTRTFLSLDDEAEAGDDEILLSADPVGWQVGDSLVLPDTRPMTLPWSMYEREYGTTIAAIDGRVLRLSQPLAFQRPAVREPDGTAVVMPRVANLTRNIVIRSENPAGTRGHTASVGHMAHMDLRYTQFVGVGRTTFADIHNTVAAADGTILSHGANQIGKYATHFHHNGSSLESRALVGNSYDGTFGSKWAAVVHVTHDALVKDNVIVDFQGGGIVTEDGPEVRNTFERNFVAYSKGNGRGALENFETGPGFHSPGGEGSGGWFRGPQNRFIGNEFFNNFIGYNFFTQNFVGAGTAVPSVRGGEPDTVYDLHRAVPIEFDGAVAVSNTRAGVEYWSTQRFPARNVTTAYNLTQISAPISPVGTHLYFPGLKAAGHQGTGTGIASARAYTDTVDIEDGFIVGCNEGTQGGVAMHAARFKNVRMQNVVNIDFSGQPAKTEMTNVTHVPLGDNPHRFVVFGAGYRWDGVSPLSYLFFEDNFFTNQGSPHRLVNEPRTGKNYLLYDAFQVRTEPAMFQAGRADAQPFPGLTVGELWDRTGLAAGGAVVAPEDLVVLDGFINKDGSPALLREADADPIPVPRTVLVYPNRLSPVVVSDADSSPRVWMSLQLTGDPAQADNSAYLSIDGGPTRRILYEREYRGGTRVYNATGAEVTPGRHVLLTWREKDGAKVAGSEMTFDYTVPDPTNPDEEPLPEPVNCVQGEWTEQGVSESEWVTVGDHQERIRTITETRETLTAPANGGAPCGPSMRQRTETETRPLEPTPDVWTDIGTLTVRVQQHADGRIRQAPE